MWTMPRSVCEQWSDGYDEQAAKKMIQSAMDRRTGGKSVTLSTSQEKSSFNCMAVPRLESVETLVYCPLRRHKSDDTSLSIQLSMTIIAYQTLALCQG